MSDPNATLSDHVTPEFWRRYEHWRARRHEQFLAKHAHRVPGLRNRRGARRLVLALGASILLLVAGAILSFFTWWFVIPFTIAAVSIVSMLGVIRLATGSVADAPTPSLDEIQLAQRNSARAIGFMAIYVLMFVPYAILIWLSTEDTVSGDAVYGTAVLLISLMLAGACVPTALTAWWMADPEPDDMYPDDEYPAGADPDSEYTHRADPEDVTDSQMRGDTDMHTDITGGSR